MEYEIKTKDELIDKLNRQIERSRQIDIEMEEKERGLLRDGGVGSNGKRRD